MYRNDSVTIKVPADAFPSRKERFALVKKRSTRLPELVHTYRGVKLDPFQQDAIIKLQQDMSTLVCAPTGTGKTLIAEWLVENSLQAGRRVIYTVPLKALASQKFREFSQRFGVTQAGIVTGDVSHQSQAGVVVMTTEILRNTLLRGEGLDPQVDWIVFDEFHFIDHPERGTAWEETILLLDAHVHLLGLSATVTNAEELGAWISRAHGDEVAVLRHEDRAVPLIHRFFNQACQAVPREQLLEVYLRRLLPERDDLDLKAGAVRFEEVWEREDLPAYDETTHHLDLVFHAARNGMFPLLYFAFSRRGCEQKAGELARRRDYLRPKEKESVRVGIKQLLQEMQATSADLPGFSRHQDLWYRGVGVHHAGLLPAVKRIVETLLERRILRVVYATETFAVGVNMPVRTVAFDSLEKPVNGKGGGTRPLDVHEYFQMAGRAGRRGWDRQGTSLVLSDFSRLHRHPPPDWTTAPMTPIRSRLRVSYNMVANLLMRFTDQEIRHFFDYSLAQYQAVAGEREPADRLWGEFCRRRDVLQALGYVHRSGAGGWLLTDRGQALRHCAVKELLMCELLFDDTLNSLSVPQLAGMAAALAADAGRGHSGHTASRVQRVPGWVADLTVAQERLIRKGGTPLTDEIQVDHHPAPAVTAWAEGTSLETIIDDFGWEPGDFVTITRQALDVLGQWAAAAGPRPQVRDRIRQSCRQIDRGVVRVVV